MPSKWAAVLTPGSTSRQEFDKLLVQRVEQEFEPEEDIISCVLTSLLEAADVKALTAELDEVFEDQAGVISDWCWETLTQLAARQSQTSESGTVAESDSPPAAAQQQERAEQHQQQQQQTSKRAPIRFNLQEAAAPETAPKKASEDTAQRLGASKPAAPQPPEKKPQQPPAPAVPQPSTSKTEQQQQQQPRQLARPAPGGSSASTRQRGAPAASARLLSMTGLIRPAEGAAGSGGRDSRVQRRQQDHREQQQQQQQQQQPPRLEQQSPQQRKRPFEEPAEPSRPAPRASARRGPASAVAGAGSMFRSAVGSLVAGSRQPEAAAAAAPPQQQQQAGATSVFARINRDDLARLGVPQPQQQAAGSKQAPPAANRRRPDTQQQQQQQQQQPNQPPGFIDGLPKSLQGRLGGLPGRPPAAAAVQGAASAAQHAKPSAAAGTAAASVVGAKRKAEVAPAAAAAAAAAPKASAPGKAATPAQAQEATQQQGVPTAKKTRTAAAAPAAAAGSKEAELAALRAQLQAREAEVLRLKQAAESDAVSVAVFGVSPRVPDTVLMAHFRPAAQSCGANIRRCTLLAGRFPPHVAAPGAYVEFEGLGGDAAARARAAAQATANALQLSGSMLLDQKITVVRKADWQGNQNKGQRAYAQPAAGNRSWRLEPGVGTGSAPAGNAAAGVAGS